METGTILLNLYLLKTCCFILICPLSDPSYRGFHVIVAAGKVFKAKTGEKASQLLASARKKYPKEIPAITYIPDADTLILWL